ncbi:MAG: CDP-alcohol phosphatidyltransferase family protein [Caulobacterales bacterium]
MADAANRRPLKSRGAVWAQALAAALARADAGPDLISAASVAVSVFGGALLLWAGASEGWARSLILVGVAAAIQLRLLCNLLDGMVAVEHGRGSAAGPIWNELPDRFADVVLLACAGYSVWGAGIPGGVELGWICASLALITAYLRELGRGFGFPADFSGPMAKPHRMAALTVAALVSAAEPLWGWRGPTLMIALAIIALGGALTVARRTRTLARRLAERNNEGEDP